jgi:integrase
MCPTDFNRGAIVMKRKYEQLSTTKVASLNEPGRYPDGGGLYLQVQVGKSGGVSKQWLFRYEYNGTEHLIGLGSERIFSLKQARQRALEKHRLLADDINPLAQKRQAAAAALEAAAKPVMTFKEAAEEYAKATDDENGNVRHRAQFGKSMASYVYPQIGHLPVEAIDERLILNVLQPLWKRIPVSASRLRARLENILNYATVKKYRPDLPNPATYKGKLEHVLKKPKNGNGDKQHHTALPYADVPAFMTQLRERPGVEARALEFLVLTATRSNEVLGAEWSEIDLDAKTWTVPAERMKARKEHKIPLTADAITLLQGLQTPREANPYVFAGRRDQPLGPMTLRRVLERLGSDVNVHGFRSTFRDWAAETTAHPSDVCEAALAHLVANKVEAAYRRGDLFEKRRLLMDDWSRFCTATPSTVVSIRKRRG